jgi:tetratricopeptide (TPR) repeat protein
VRRLGVLLLAASAGAGPEAAVGLNEEGLERLHAGRAHDALASFEAALALLPGDRTLARNTAAALAAVAEERLGAGADPWAAAALLDRAVSLHPERSRYRLLRARARAADGSWAGRASATEDLALVLEADPDHVEALVHLAHLAWLDRRLEEAVRLLGRARALRPADGDIRERAERAEREMQVEAAFSELESPVVRVRYGPAIARAAAERVLTLCEEARSRLSNRFRHWPETRVSVTLYAPGELRSATGVHAWVAGLSDGTIRLTVRDGTSPDALRATVSHEITHHLVRDLAPRAPIWLHEGLAQLAEERSVAQAHARLRAGSPPRAADLDANVLAERDPQRVARFYDTALGFTAYLLELQGDAGMRRLLDGLRSQGDAALVIREIHGASRDELFARWLDRLRAG